MRYYLNQMAYLREKIRGFQINIPKPMKLYEVMCR